MLAPCLFAETTEKGATMKPSSVTLTALLLLIIALSSPLHAAAAPEWLWTGQASPDQNWYARKDTGVRDPDDKPIYVNNWGYYSTGSPPAPGGGNVTIGASFTAWVDHDQNPVINELLLGTGATLHLYNGGRLSVQGPSLLVDGELRVHYGGWGGAGLLTIDGATTLHGSGDVLFQDAATMDGAALLTIADGFLLHGFGATIDTPLDNRGTIHADTANGWISLRSTAKSNSGTFKASGGGFLGISTPVSQSGAGQVVADGGTVQLFNGSTLTGGKTVTANDGKLFVSGGGTVVGVTDITNQGGWLVQDGSIAAVGGSLFINSGTFNVGGYTGGSGWGRVRLLSGVELSGAGELLLSPGIVESSGGFALTNGVNQKIHGYGEITVTLVNNGTLLADQGGQALSLGGTGDANNAVMKATGGGFLDLRTIITQSAQGRIAADDVSTVRLYNGSAISGGVMATSGSGGFFVGGGGVAVTLIDSSNEGSWLAQDGSTVNLGGSSFANSGIFNVGGYTGGSGWARLRLASGNSVTGAGTILLSPGIIDSPGGYSLTNSAGHAIRGYGEIQSGLVNYGVVDCDRTGNLVLNGAAKSNFGMLKASNGRTLEIRTTLNQSGSGTLQADGAFVWLDNGAVISGGVMESPNGGKLHSDSRTVTFTDTTNRGWLFGQNCAKFQLTGATFTNDGVFEIGGYTGGCGLATVTPVNGLVLQGSGALLLQPGYVTSDTPVTFVNAATHTIRGSYARMYGNVRLDNRGTLEAFNGTLDLDGSPVQFAGNTLTGGSWKATNGALNINGAAAVTINQGSVLLSGAGTLPQLAPLADNRGLFALSGGKLFTTSGALLNSGTVTVDPASRLTVNGGYSAAAGSTTRIDGQLVTSAPAAIQGVLGGAGTTGDIVLGATGTISPGDSTGVLTTGSLTINSGATYRWEYRTPTDADLVRVTGALDLGSAQLKLDITLLDGAPAPALIKLFEFGSLAGAVARSQIILPKHWSFASIDTTGHQLSLVGVTYDPNYRLSVDFASLTTPKGGGHVAVSDNSSNPPLITTCSGTPNPCVSLFLDGAPLLLTPYPDSDSLFTSWSGACSGSGSCGATMSADRSVTATFSYVPPAWTEGTTRYYASLQTACGEAMNGQSIRARQFTFTENLTLDQGRQVTIRGGYAPNYLDRPGATLLKGKLTIGKGVLVADRLILQ